MIEGEVLIDVPFHDVDMMAITWHGHYVKYFEIARCHLLDNIGYNYKQMRDSGYSWPVIDLNIRYVRPSHFSQKLRVTARIAEWENRLLIKYMITDANTGERLTRGHTTQVAVDIATGEMCFASPSVLLEKLGLRDQ